MSAASGKKSRKRSSSVSSAATSSKKRTTGRRRFNRDNFFDSDDDNSDVPYYPEGEEEEDHEHAPIDPVITPAGPDDELVDAGQPSGEEYDMIQRHREVFMDRAFGGDEDQANNVICRPQDELDHIIFILEHWDVDTPLKSIEDPEHYKAMKDFCDTQEWIQMGPKFLASTHYPP